MRPTDVTPGTLVEVTTPLRPSGKVRLGDDRFEARAEGQWFDTGQTVAVLRADGFGLVVGDPQAAGPQPTPPPPAPPINDQVNTSNKEAETTEAPVASNEDSDGTAKVEQYIAGLIAFVAFGTFVGAMGLLFATATTNWDTMIRGLPFYLCGGAIGGFLLYHVILILLAVGALLWRRLPGWALGLLTIAAGIVAGSPAPVAQERLWMFGWGGVTALLGILVLARLVRTVGDPSQR